MINITREFLAGKWIHQEWSCEMTMFNYLVIEWPNGSKAYGAWLLRGQEIILTFNYTGKEEKIIYIFSVLEIIDNNKIKTLDIEKNKEEIMERQIT